MLRRFRLNIRVYGNRCHGAVLNYDRRAADGAAVPALSRPRLSAAVASPRSLSRCQAAEQLECR